MKKHHGESTLPTWKNITNIIIQLTLPKTVSKYYRQSFLLFTLMFMISFTGYLISHAQTCGLDFPNGPTIEFGSLEKAQVSNEIILDINNTGTETADVSVSAKNWLDGNSVSHVLGNFTKFATSDMGAGTQYEDKTSLNNTDSAISMGTIAPASTNSTYWQLDATMQNLPFSGVLTQEITFTSQC